MEYEVGKSEAVSTAVVRVVSAANGRDPCSLPPLTDVLDPDALDRIFSSQQNGEPRTGGHVSFVYEHYRVTVDNGEYITARPIDSQPKAVSDGDADPAGNERAE